MLFPLFLVVVFFFVNWERSAWQAAQRPPQLLEMPQIWRRMWAEGLVSDVILGCVAGPFPSGPARRAGLPSLSPAATRTEPSPEEAEAVTKELEPDSQPGVALARWLYQERPGWLIHLLPSSRFLMEPMADH